MLRNAIAMYSLRSNLYLSMPFFFVPLVCLGFLLPIAESMANAVTVIGNSQQSRQCYTVAKMMGQRKMHHLADPTPCDNALRTAMNRRDRSATLINRGLIRAALLNFEGAHQDYDKAVKLSSKYTAVVFINRGNAYYLQRYFDQALDNYTKAIEMGVEPLFVAVHNRAMVYEKLEDLDAAEAGFLHALSLHAESESAQIRLERVREKRRESLSKN
ncbi:MAG: tetratricopeptide repeat protein [Pseudomonadales bacterium]|nr:tetratricopeptide repeat protein [Pseudomonadales bacterium]